MVRVCRGFEFFIVVGIKRGIYRKGIGRCGPNELLLEKSRVIFRGRLLGAVDDNNVALNTDGFRGGDAGGDASG